MFYYLNSNVRFLRKKNNMSAKELAELLDMTRTSITNFEGGQRNVSIEVLDKLHNIFNISIDDLIYKDLEASEEA